MDYEAALISKVLMENRMEEVIDARVRPELFVAYSGLWSWLTKTYAEHGGAPPVDFVEKKFPGFEIQLIDSPMSFLIDELRKRRTHMLIAESMKLQADKLKDKDPMGALEEVRTVLLKADQETRPSRDVNLVDDPMARYDAYKELAASGGITGLPSIWPCLDEVTQGFHPEELIMFAGRGGVGKTWVEVVLARHLWSLGHRILLFTREMGVWQIIRRLDAVNAQLSYRRLRSGTLTSKERERWKQALKDMKGSTDFWVTGDDEGTVGVSGIIAKIRRYRPAMALIDGGYLIEDERGGKAGWEKFSNVCWDLKRAARKEGIPIGISHQFNLAGKGDKGDADTMKYGDVQMWFDLMIGQYQTEALRLNNEMMYRILKQREGEKLEWVSDWDLERMVFDVKVTGVDEVPEEYDPEEVVRF